jgi:glucosylceramidase
VWEAKTLANFMAGYLMPAMEKKCPGTEIWLGTLNNDTIEYVEKMLELRPEIKNIKGFGVQWAGIDMIDDLGQEYPGYKIMQTESECNNGLNNWFTAEHTFSLLHESFKNGCNSYMYWNMILDEMGLSTWMWRQNSMITIDKFTKEVRYNPEFFVMKHFSYFIQPGAKRIEIQGEIGLHLAFQNPDGSVVVIIGNQTDKKQVTNLKVKEKYSEVEIPPHSVNTFLIVD